MMRNGCVVDMFGTKKWYGNNQLHREDGPAIENANGETRWYLDGKLHREDGPAIIFHVIGFSNSNNKEWFRNGQRHREDGPAVEYVNGHKEWWLNDTRATLNGNYCTDQSQFLEYLATQKK